MSSFRRRIGAAADVKELEYIAALHQTCAPTLRKNGTISSIDLMRFLKSRTNLNVSHDHCIRLVRGLGGGIVGEDVIADIREEQNNLTLQQMEETKKKRLKTKVKVAGAFSVLRKKHQKDMEEEQEVLIPQEPFSMEGRKDHEDKKERHGLFHRLKKHQQDETDHHLDTDNHHDTDGQQQHDDEQDLEDPHDDVDADEMEKEEFLDLVQVTAILLMPTLARAGKKWKDSQHLEVFQEEPPTPEYKGVKGWTQKKLDQREKKEQQAEKDLHASLDPKPSNIIPDVLKNMLASVNASSGKSKFPLLNAALVKNLLLASGEYERAADAVLVDKMVEAAYSSSGLFDEEAFVNALTSDLRQWKVGCEDRNTTSFFDVYGFESYREQRKMEEQRKEAAEKEAAANGQDTDEQASHQLDKSGLGMIVGADAGSTDAAGSDPKDDDITVEDDIVPSTVQLPARLMNLQSPDRSIFSTGSMVSTSAMSVVTFDESALETPQARHLNEAEDEPTYKLDRTKTPLDIDFAIDMHSSIVLTVLIFFFFMTTSLVYATLILQIPELDPNCGQEFGCTLGAKVITWMVFACILAGTGYLVIIPLSLGNQPTERSPRRLMLAFVLALIIAWIPYLAVESYENSIQPPYTTGPEKSVNEPNYNASQWVTRFLGTLTSLVILWQFFLSCIGNRRIRANKFMNKYFSPSAVRGSAREKKAATRKINNMLENAYKLAPKAVSTTAVKEEIMMNFVLRGESFEEVGGLIWTWKRLFSGKLFANDGVWIMTRLIIIQVVQLLLIAFYGYSGVLLVEEVAKQAQNFQDTLQPGYPEWVYTFVPTPQQAQAALYPAVGVALFVMLSIFLIYLPSYVRTIFQFRCGTRPSLKSSEFLKYRVAVDAVYTNIGNAVFAMIGSAFIFFALIGLVLFLFIWPFSRNFMVLLVAWGLGLCITIVIKMVLVKNCRKRFYAGFYRTNPNGANLATLALECWFIGMGGGVLVGRFTQFILAACFFVGRTDVPFLSKDVALFGYAFDYVPTNFVKDILVHEAHKHPYFERLLSQYLMKLRYDKYGTEAGACWRQLFVTTLMPWMIKLRVFYDKRLEETSLEEYNAMRLERMSSSKPSISSDTHQPDEETRRRSSHSSMLDQVIKVRVEVDEEGIS